MTDSPCPSVYTIALHNETLPCLIVYPGLLLLMNRPDGDGAAICWLSLCSRTTSSSASLTFIIVYHITRRPVVFLRRLGLCSFGEDLGNPNSSVCQHTGGPMTITPPPPPPNQNSILKGSESSNALWHNLLVYNKVHSDIVGGWELLGKSRELRIHSYLVKPYVEEHNK